MTWAGRIVGLVLGYLTAGPLGAVLGLVAGYWIDRALAAPRAGAGGASNVQHVFFNATFSVMGHLCKVDGRVSEAEIGVAEALMTRMRLSAQAREEAIARFNQGKRADFDLDAELAELQRVCRRQPKLVRVFLEIQLQAAFADGRIDAAEHDVIRHIAESLGLTRQEYARLEALLRRWYARGSAKPARGDAVADAYKELGVDRDASDSEVKRAYRRLMSQHHPDKLAAKGLPKEMMKIAGERTARIRSAYDTVREARGN